MTAKTITAIRFIVTSSSSPHRARGAPRRPDPASWRTETKYNDIWQGCASFSYHKSPQQELAVARWGQGERTPDTASVPVRLSKIPPRSWEKIGRASCRERGEISE